MRRGAPGLLATGISCRPSSHSRAKAMLLNVEPSTCGRSGTVGLPGGSKGLLTHSKTLACCGRFWQLAGRQHAVC